VTPTTEFAPEPITLASDNLDHPVQHLPGKHRQPGPPPRRRIPRRRDRERIGQHYGRWRDTIFIERRSPAI